MNSGERGYRRYNIKIPIINLDMEEKIKEVEKEVEERINEEAMEVEVQNEDENAEQRQKIDDKKAILLAAKGLQFNIRDREGRVSRERLEERIAGLMEMYLAQVDE